MKVKQFMDSAEQKGEGGSIIKWTDKGKIIFYLHPNSEIEERWVHRFPTLISKEVDTEKGKKIKKQVITERIICPDPETCFIHRLIKKLNKLEDLEDEEVLIKLGKKSNKIEICKGDLLGKQSFDWHYNLTARKEFVFIVVTVKNPSIGKLIVPTSLGEKVAAVIKDQMEEEGEDTGNPFKNPYAFKATFDPDKAGTDMYNAHYNSKKPSEEVEELFETSPPDISGLINPTPYLKVLSLMQEAIEHPRLEKFLLKLEEKAEELDEGLEKTTKKKKKKKKEKEEDEEETSEDEEEEDGEEEKEKKKKKKRKKDNDEDEEDESDDDEDEDEEETKKKKKKKKKNKKVICHECESEVDEDSKTCPECGEDLDIPF